VLLLLFVLVLLTIAFRYPTVDHERYQADSYFIHLLSQTIVDDGRATWTFSPLSYIGYYPLSYPSGAPFLMADLAQLTGLTVEATILLAGMLFGLMFCLVAFCIAREFLFESRFVLLATLFVVTGSRFVDNTYWVGSARGPLVVLMMLSLLVAFRASSLKRSLLLLVAIVLTFGCLAIHHMAVFYFFFAVAFMLASFGADYVIKKAKVHKKRVFALYTAAVVTAIAVVAFGFITIFTGPIVAFGDESLFNSQSTLVSIVLNMSASYTSQIGFILPVAIIGIPFVYRMRRLDARQLYPLMLLVSLMPMLGHIMYVAMLMAPFVAVLGTMWIARWFNPHRRNRFAVFALVAIVAGSMLLPSWNIERWNSHPYMTGDTVEVPSQVFSDAAYLEYAYSNGYVISNAIVLSAQLSSISGARFLSSGIGSVLSGDITSEQVEGNVTLSVANFPRNLLELLSYDDELHVDSNVNSIMVAGARFAIGANSEYFKTHSHLIVVVDRNWPSTLVTQYFSRPAVFPSELLSASWRNLPSTEGKALDSYLMYQSERVSLFIVQLPV
jgi:hypothetical protein